MIFSIRVCGWVEYNWKSHENQIDNKLAWQCHVSDIYKTITLSRHFIIV